MQIKKKFYRSHTVLARSIMVLCSTSIVLSNRLCFVGKWAFVIFTLEWLFAAWVVNQSAVVNGECVFYVVKCLDNWKMMSAPCRRRLPPTSKFLWCCSQTARLAWSNKAFLSISLEVQSSVKSRQKLWQTWALQQNTETGEMAIEPRN